MDLVPRRPFGEVSKLRREMEDLWNRVLGEMPFPRFVRAEWEPSVDISEVKDNIIIKVELPGMDAKDVNVSISENTLTIKGEKKREKEEKDEYHYSCERYFGSYQRAFQLPASIEADKVEAAFDKGVLTITLPKVEGAKKKEIEIKVK